jgi:hypothetical protein
LLVVGIVNTGAVVWSAGCLADTADARAGVAAVSVSVANVAIGRARASSLSAAYSDANVAETLIWIGA